MAHVMAKIGWPVAQLDGGYREFRRYVNASLTELPQRFTFRVICGPTGSGKSRLLQALAEQGAQVLDLEKIAVHRGSVLGHFPAVPQPSQKAFESRIWEVLQGFDPQSPIFVESESKKVGNLRVPDAVMQKMRLSSCIIVALARPDRVRLLMEDYSHFIADPELLRTQLACLTARHGRERVGYWQKLALSGQIEELVDALLTKHYDPAYTQSIKRNFDRYAEAQTLELPDISDATFLNAARQLHLVSRTFHH